MGLTRDSFPDKQEGDILGAEHVNKLNKVARTFTSMFGGSFSMGDNARTLPFPPFVQIPIEVITETCDGDSDLLEVRPLYYDIDTNMWRLNDEVGPYCLDPTVFDLSFSTGDRLTAWWDPQRDMFLPMTSSVCDTIHFTIITADCIAKTALVQIDARNCGCSKVPEEDSYEQLTVNDSMGCHLDEPDTDLIGREGSAKYMKIDYTGVCQWEIDNLCCAPDVCT